tara:strand:+ start:703 stop:1035 length:333 start_codon:yes stop_codon:yes gene_type:complete
MNLFDYVNQRRQQGIERAATSAGDAWTREATAFVRGYLIKNPSLFVDDLWAAGLPRPTSPRALGSVLQQASRAGWMTKKTADTGEILAMPSAASNGQLKAVWKSELYPQP